MRQKLDSNWNFNIDDTSARLTVPPVEVSLPVRQAANVLREAMDACRRAALELGAAVRTSSQAGYGTRWILGAAGLSFVQTWKEFFAEKSSTDRSLGNFRLRNALRDSLELLMRRQEK